MKKTSIFFLIIALILIGGGIYIKNQAVERAEAKGIELFRQELNEAGNLVEVVEFPTENTNKININLKNADINIIGNATSSYAEIINFNTIEYSAYCNNRSFNIDDDLISAIAGRAESGNISFNGVRDFVRFNKHNTEKIVNIYLAADSAVKKIDINIKNGNINVNGLQTVCDYNVNINKGDLAFNNTPRLSLIKTEINKGNVILNNTHVENSDINIKNGNLTFSTAPEIIYDYNVEAETGEIKYNDQIHKGKFTVENPEINGDFTAHIGVGNVTITTIAPVVTPPVDAPVETAPQPAETAA